MEVPNVIIISYNCSFKLTRNECRPNKQRYAFLKSWLVIGHKFSWPIRIMFWCNLFYPRSARQLLLLFFMMDTTHFSSK